MPGRCAGLKRVFWYHQSVSGCIRLEWNLVCGTKKRDKGSVYIEMLKVYPAFTGMLEKRIQYRRLTNLRLFTDKGGYMSHLNVHKTIQWSHYLKLSYISRHQTLTLATFQNVFKIYQANARKNIGTVTCLYNSNLYNAKILTMILNSLCIIVCLTYYLCK